MKNIFKGSLIAASVALTFASNAADLSISTPPVAITAEAAAAGVATPAQDLTIRVINREELVPGDIITLSFPLGTTFTNALTDLTIDYGNGTFTFTNITLVPATATVGPKITLEVELGNPVIANSAFDLVFANVGGDPVAPGSGSVTYVAEDGTSGDPKDTAGNNSVALTTDAEQRVISALSAIDGFVDRLDRDTFNDKGSLAAVLSFQSVTTGVVADEVVGAGNDILVLNGDFNVESTATVSVCDDDSDPVVAFGASQATVTCGSGNLVQQSANATCEGTCATGGADTITIEMPTIVTAIEVAPLANEVVLTFGDNTGTANQDLALTDIVATHTVIYQGATAIASRTFEYFADLGVGKTQLDASVVNVPYLPVGYGLTAQVEIANLGNNDAEVVIEAVDQDGMTYGPATLDFTYGGATYTTARAGTVTRASEADIRKAFGGLAEDSRKKLSITFVIDADVEDITLVPLYRQNESRINVISDQYKGQ